MDQHPQLLSASDPGLQLIDGDHLIYPLRVEPNLAVFRLPRPPAQVWLRSRSDRPARSQLSDDNRLLGFSVWCITIQDSQTTICVEPPQLAGAEGFYEPELPRHIWTNGLALLPERLFEGLSGELTLCVQGDGLPSYAAESDAAKQAQEVMRGVLSLGENCEIGFAQEHFDAEPIDLLRWANSSFSQLCSGLHSGFAGLGDEAHTELVWMDTEYRLIDRRYASFHTMAFAQVDAGAQAKLWHDGVLRLQFLRRKLLHDLAEGRRLVVYRTRQSGFSMQDAYDLLDALRGHGPAPLLVLTPAFLPFGVVEEIGGGLFLGGFDPVASGPEAFYATLHLCQSVRALLA